MAVKSELQQVDFENLRTDHGDHGVASDPEKPFIDLGLASSVVLRLMPRFHQFCLTCSPLIMFPFGYTSSQLCVHGVAQGFRQLPTH